MLARTLGTFIEEYKKQYGIMPGLIETWWAAIKSVEGSPSASGYTPCPKFRCNRKCRIGYKCKCGGIACRVERHSV